jgi:hypothetical protein
VAKLALAVTRDAAVEGTQVMLPVDRRTGEAAARQGGAIVLVYEAVPPSILFFIGQGRVSAVEYGPGKRAVAVRLADYVRFATPVPGEAEAVLPRVRSMLRLSDERFAQILGETALPVADPEIQERQASLETRVSIKRQVLRNWGNRCAITGRRDHLDIVAIRPREAGGQLHARNYMPMIPIAARAWEQGVISVAANGDVIADLPALDPDLLESMDKTGRLLLPDDPMRRPDAADLGFHRQYVFGSKKH